MERESKQRFKDRLSTDNRFFGTTFIFLGIAALANSEKASTFKGKVFYGVCGLIDITSGSVFLKKS